MRTWYTRTRKIATNFTVVSDPPKPGPAEQLRHRGTPLRERRTESEHEEEDVVPGRNGTLKGPVGLPREPFLSVSFDGPAASPRDHDPESCRPAPV